MLTDATTRAVEKAREVLREKGLTDDQIEAELNRDKPPDLPPVKN